MKLELLRYVLEKFKDCKVAILGDVILDKYYWGKVERISPEAPVPIVSIYDKNYKLGGAANVAANIVSAGGKTALFSVLGDDSENKYVVNELKNLGIEDYTLSIANRKTTVKTRIISQNQQIVRIDEEDISLINYNLQRKILEKLKANIDDFDGIVISDYSKGVIVEDLFVKIVDLFKSRQKFVIVDPRQKNFHFYLNQTLITPNVKESQEALGRIFSNENYLLNGGKDLLELTNSDGILMTRSEKGMTLFRRNKEPITIPTRAVHVYDVTGAGDTVIALVALCLALKLDFVQCAEISNIAAGIVVGKIGTSVATSDEILGYYNHYMKDTDNEKFDTF